MTRNGLQGNGATKRHNQSWAIQGGQFFKSHVLTLGDLPWLREMGEVEDGIFKLERNRTGRKLRTPVSVPVDRILGVGQKGLVEFIMDSFVSDRPKLIPFVLENRSLIELAKYLLRYRSGSLKTLYLYANLVYHFSAWSGRSPDELIADVRERDGSPNFNKIQAHVKTLEDYVGELQDRKLAPNRVASYAKAVKALYKVNGVRLELPCSLSQRTVSKSRAPTPEELLKLLEVADLRGRVIVSMFALGGFREGTLVRLRCRHVRRDLEAGVVPIHIHVESEITKGKYHDYDTFLGPEAAGYLRLYIENRRNGSPDGKIPPERITDESPLIRDSRARKTKPIGEKQIHRLIHDLYFRAGLLTPNTNGYRLTVHSLRKFFKTQLMALRVQPDYIDYMMGHTIDTYHDIQMKGVEFLRQQYTNANLRIRPAPRLSPVDQLKIFAKGLGLDPERIVSRGESFVEPHRAFVSPLEAEDVQVRALSSAIKESIKREIIQDFETSVHGWHGETFRSF